MKFLQYTLLLAVICLSGAMQAQSQIQSKEDYKKVQASINAVSKRLFEYARLYPTYSFAAQYDDAGKVVAMDVKGVPNSEDAQRIATYLMKLESLGELVRTMNVAYLPEIKGNPAKTMLSENQALNYTPTFEREPVASAL